MRIQLLIVCVLASIGCTAQVGDGDSSSSSLVSEEAAAPGESEGGAEKPPLPPPPHCGPRCFTDIVGEARDCMPVELLHKRAIGFCMEHRAKLTHFRPLGACPVGSGSIAKFTCCAPPPPPPCPPGEKCPPPPPPPCPPGEKCPPPPPCPPGELCAPPPPPPDGKLFPRPEPVEIEGVE